MVFHIHPFLFPVPFPDPIYEHKNGDGDYQQMSEWQGSNKDQHQGIEDVEMPVLREYDVQWTHDGMFSDSSWPIS